MRKILFIFLCTICTSFVFCNEANKWDILIRSIIHIESEGKQHVTNHSCNCAGILQITPILVKDCNRILKEKSIDKSFTLQDRYDVDKSIEMFNIIQDYYNPNKDIEHAIRLWKGGTSYTKANTQRYYNKVMNEYKKRLSQS